MVSRSVIVTGGLGDIGMAVAHAFARQGASILLVDAREDDAGEYAAALREAGAAAAAVFRGDVGDGEVVAQSVHGGCGVGPVRGSDSGRGGVLGVHFTHRALLLHIVVVLRSGVLVINDGA